MIKKLPKSIIEFELTIPWKDWEKYLHQALENISKEIKIPGFRPGKAPRTIIEKKVGREKILNEAAGKAIQKNYVDFIIKEKLEVIGSPEIEIKKISEGENLCFVARAAVLPEINIDEKYKKEIGKINQTYENKKIEITEDEIMLEIDRIASSRAKLVTVRREARKNDSVEIDFTVLMDGVPIENGKSKNHPLIIGKEVFIPGFEDNLLGLKEGMEKEFDLEFPQNYHNSNLAGKKANFKVRMNLVQERQIPEVNDEFAKSLGNFDSLKSFKENMRQGILDEKAHKLKEQRRNEYIEKITEYASIELPDILIKDELHKMFHEFEHQVQSMGLKMEDYLEKINKKRQDLEKEWEPNAIKRVTLALAMKNIFKKEEITIESKEVEDEMNKTIKYYDDMKNISKNIDMERLYNYTKGVLENEKVFQMLEKLK